MRFHLIATLLLLALAGNSSYAQLIKGRRNKKHEKPPAFILIQLRSEQRKITYLEQAGKYDEAKRVERDAEAAATAMKNDFMDNFSFCPVYYFVDTNLEKVKAHQLNDILFTEAGTTVTNTPNMDSLFFVIYFTKAPKKESSVGLDGAGLEVLDTQFKLHPNVHLTTISLLTKEINASKRGPYYYKSDRYEIFYYPCAAKLQQQLEKVFH